MEAIILGSSVDSRIPPPPTVLRGKLVFGDPEQIKALRQYEQDVAVFDDPNMEEWVVDVEVAYSDRVIVVARSREEAIEMAMERFDLSIHDCDVDYSAHKKPRSRRDC